MASESLHNEEMNSLDDFETIYETNAPLIYRFMLWRTKDEMLAEDLTSSVFEKAWRSRSSYQFGSVKAWLYKIAHHTLIDHWRKKKEIPSEDLSDLAIDTSHTDLEQILDQDLLLDRLQVAVTKLPADMQAVIKLRFIWGLSSRQTAQRLDLSEANVRVIQYRALRKLRGYLQ